MTATHVHVGDLIPDFSMDAYDPTDFSFVEVKLKNNLKKKKWTILFFYPADFTFVCPTELADLAEKHAELKKLGVEVISVSTDTKYTHMGWRQSEGMIKNVKYLMGADPTGAVSRMFGVYDELSGLSKRGTFIINPEGKVVGSEVSYDNVGRNAEELVRKVKAHVYLAAHPDEACPAKWEMGDKTLTPGADIVGKVFEALN